MRMMSVKEIKKINNPKKEIDYNPPTFPFLMRGEEEEGTSSPNLYFPLMRKKASSTKYIVSFSSPS